MHPFPGLPPSVAREAFAELCRALPPPIDGSQDARDTLAMEAAAAFRPADLTEALMVVEIVATEAHARACLREAGEHQADIKVVRQSRAQALSMMRQKQRALRMLHEYQAARPSAPAEPVMEQQAEPTSQPSDRSAPMPPHPRTQPPIVIHAIGLGLPGMDRATVTPRRHADRDRIVHRYA